MLHFFESVLRPILEYVRPAWHNNQTPEKCDHTESIEKRALPILVGFIDNDYE